MKGIFYWMLMPLAGITFMIWLFLLGGYDQLRYGKGYIDVASLKTWDYRKRTPLMAYRARSGWLQTSYPPFMPAAPTISFGAVGSREVPCDRSVLRGAG